MAFLLNVMDASLCLAFVQQHIWDALGDGKLSPALRAHEAALQDPHLSRPERWVTVREETGQDRCGEKVGW